MKFRMWSANDIERTKEVLSIELPMTYTVYHIRKQTVSHFSSFCKKSKSSIYATFQKIKTQFFAVMSIVKNVDLIMFVKVAASECILYILIYISEWKLGVMRKTGLKNPNKKFSFLSNFRAFLLQWKRTKTKEASYDSSNHFIRKDYRARLR